ncbi:ATP-binding protein [Singulisphaera acidiphila]|uniref:histidine kinase n=1 Tax=Singulisphaera acidiphila (strain ATCC BAA-1392 / DSM 18658 / VKM B-2454 / MOB10) TaxID=886293 RepID=L0D7H1_SINAD|nr:ATP-binding protein [Singulisphaera acidiphila]AGA25192.1 histidine kinase,histidine kinase [Singulisphaera acidiphila DSM 18658]
MNRPLTSQTGSPRLAKRVLARLIAPVVMVSLLLMAVGSVAAYHVHRLQQDTTDLLTRDVSGIRAAEELVITISQIETHVDQFLLTGDRRHLNPIPSHRGEIDRWLGEADRLTTTSEEQSLLTQVRSGLDHFWGILTEQRKGKEAEVADESTRDAFARHFNSQILSKSQEYLDAMEEEVETASAQNQAMPSRVAVVLLLLGTCGAIAGLLAGFGIARGISRSIAQLSIPIRDAAGKLNEVVGPITLSPAWDIDSLEAVLREMANEIGTVVARLEVSRREVLRGEQFAALGQMAAGLAHELRNPLTSMKILVQSATERGDEAGLRGRSLEVLLEEITRLEHSIQGFLNFAKPPEVEKRVFALSPVLEQILGLVATQAALKSIAISYDLPEAPTIIEADIGHLRQVLLNLLINAMDATPEGGTIQTRIVHDIDNQGPEEGGRAGSPAVVGKGTMRWLSIQVLDSGCGLPADLGDRIFEPFVSTKETGLGLGLSICKRIVEAHGGRITAADRPEGGAVFTVRLPFVGTSPTPAEPN